MHMESSKPKSPQKSGKNSSKFAAPSTAKAMQSVSPQPSSKSKSLSKDELKDRSGDKQKAQVVPWKSKLLTRENTKPVEIRLHSEERAIKRALFNYSVATKYELIEHQKRQVHKILKIIEEEEIRTLRKEMIPRARWMPIFDRPFVPQRSTVPLTIPKEPSFRLMGRHSLSCSRDIQHKGH